MTKADIAKMSAFSIVWLLFNFMFHGIDFGCVVAVYKGDTSTITDHFDGE